jgi:hypothetical protein
MPIYVWVWTAVQTLYSPDGSEGVLTIRVDLGVYRARIVLFWANRSEVQQGNTTKSGANLTNVCFLGILIALMLAIGHVETNPGPQTEEKMERLIDHKMAQHEEGKTI